MVDFLIKDVPEQIAARLQEIAEARGSSVEDVAREILTEAARTPLRSDSAQVGPFVRGNGPSLDAARHRRPEQ